MEMSTGKIWEQDELTPQQKESGNFIPVPRYLRDEAGRLIEMKQPVDFEDKSPLAKWAKRKKQATAKYKRRMKNKTAKLARRKNR